MFLTSYAYFSALYLFYINNKWVSKKYQLLCLPFLSDCRRHVSVSVHEALHCRRNVQTSSGLLPASPQQLLWLLRPVSPSGRLGRTRPQPLLHLLRGLSPNELLQLPCPSQMSRVWTDVLFTLLRQRNSGTILMLFGYFDLPWTRFISV